MSDKQRWLNQADKLLNELYGINLNDCGTPDEFWVRWGNEAQDGTTPIEAVEAYGRKYDLVVLGEGYDGD
jgi:hypothetical protein